MRPNHACMALLVILCVLFSCNNSDTLNSVPVSRVTFVDRGAVMADPVSTTVTIRPDSIEYVRSDSASPTEQWSKQIQSSEFDSVRNIIDMYGLFSGNDVIPGEGEPPCMGWRGMAITIDGTDASHTFEISGAACVKQRWPEGVRALVDLKDELVAKYR